MKIIPNSYVLLCSLLLISCGGKETDKKEGFSIDRKKTEVQQNAENPAIESTILASQRVDLDDKGVGPVNTISLSTDIDQSLANSGEEIYNQMCLSCHRVGKKFIGPPPDNILARRSPEWIMNMILNPEQMVRENALAKDLFLEYNGSPMANQNLSQDKARAILEFFRTLK